MTLPIDPETGMFAVKLLLAGFFGAVIGVALVSAGNKSPVRPEPEMKLPPEHRRTRLDIKREEIVEELKSKVYYNAGSPRINVGKDLAERIVKITSLKSE